MGLLLLLREPSIKTKTVGLHIYLKSNSQPKNPFFNLPSYVHTKRKAISLASCNHDLACLKARPSVCRFKSQPY